MIGRCRLTGLETYALPNLVGNGTRKSVFMSLPCSTRQSLSNFRKKIIGSSPIMTNFVLKFQKLISVETGEALKFQNKSAVLLPKIVIGNNVGNIGANRFKMVFQLFCNDVA